MNKIKKYGEKVFQSLSIRAANLVIEKPYLSYYQALLQAEDEYKIKKKKEK